MKTLTYAEMGINFNGVMAALLFRFKEIMDDDSIGEMMQLMDMADYPYAFRFVDEDPAYPEYNNDVVRTQFKVFYESQMGFLMGGIREEVVKAIRNNGDYLSL
jgi:hypothetical protein